MKKIQRPKDIAGVELLMHLAEYLLTQVVEALGCIALAPTSAAVSPTYERAVYAHTFANEALQAIRGVGVAVEEGDDGGRS